MPGRPSEEEEALRMVIAFYSIMEPDKRVELIKLAETFARESQVVDGCTHFLLLDCNSEKADVTEVSAGDASPERDVS